MFHCGTLYSSYRAAGSSCHWAADLLMPLSAVYGQTPNPPVTLPHPVHSTASKLSFTECMLQAQYHKYTYQSTQSIEHKHKNTVQVSFMLALISLCVHVDHREATLLSSSIVEQAHLENFFKWGGGRKIEALIFRGVWGHAPTGKF